MQITKEKKNNITVLRLGAEIVADKATGEIELDIDNNYMFTEAIEAEVNHGQTNFVVDLTNLSYIDSSGLGAIFDSFKLVTEKSGNIVLLNPSSDVKRVLDITQISKKVKVFSEEADALSSF